MLKRVKLEYSFQCPSKIIYDRIASASGLAEWYADDVQVNDDLFKFIWADMQECYKLVGKKANQYVNFQHAEHQDQILEFSLDTDAYSGHALLKVVLDSDEEDIEELFDCSIANLKTLIGSH